MAIDPTGNISQVMEILRRQVSTPDNAQASLKSGAMARQAKNLEKDRTARGNDPKALERKIASRIRLLPLDSDKELRTAIRVFMEDVLLAEFGDELGQDPGFYEMVEGLATTVSSDKALSGEFKTLFRSMR